MKIITFCYLLVSSFLELKPCKDIQVTNVVKRRYLVSGRDLCVRERENSLFSLKQLKTVSSLPADMTGAAPFMFRQFPAFTLWFVFLPRILNFV